MIYRFDGYPRVSLFFDTPNQCGTAAGMVACLLCGVYCRSSSFLRGRHRWIATLLLAAIAISFGVVAMTYSRASYVAIGFSLLLLAICDRGHRWRAPLLFAEFLVILAVIPAGFARIETLAMPIRDASLHNRLLVWQGALAMAWDHFPSGVGFARFREQFTAWYQAPAHFELYTTAVSDYATLAACGGLGILFLYLSAIALVVDMGFRTLNAEKDPLLMGLLASITCYLIAGACSTLILSRLMLGFFGGSMLAVVLISSVRSFEKRCIGVPNLLRACLSGAVPVLILAAVGYFCAKNIPTVPRPPNAAGLEPRPHLASLSPRNKASRATIFIIADRWFPELDARTLFRPLSAAGHDVIVFTPQDFGLVGMRECITICETLEMRASFSHPLFLLGLGEGGRLALAIGLPSANEHLRGIVAISSTFWHPLPSLSLDKLRIGRQRPVLLLHDDADRLHDPEGARRFHARALKAGIASTFFTFKGERDEPDAFWAGVGFPLCAFLNHNTNYEAVKH